MKQRRLVGRSEMSLVFGAAGWRQREPRTRFQERPQAKAGAFHPPDAEPKPAIGVLRLERSPLEQSLQPAAHGVVAVGRPRWGSQSSVVHQSECEPAVVGGNIVSASESREAAIAAAE